MNDARHTIREIELEKLDQTQAPRNISWFEHTALRPRLHTEGFPLTRPHRTSHTGKPPLRIWGNYNNREYTTPLSNTTQPLHLEARHKANTHQPHTKGIRLKATQTQSPHTWGIPTQSPPLTRGSQIHFHYHLTLEGYQLNHLSLEGYHNQWKTYNLVV